MLLRSHQYCKFLKKTDGVKPKYICKSYERHHEYGPEAPHVNKEVDLYLQQVAQRAFEAKYSHEEWMQQFGKNYL